MTEIEVYAKTEAEPRQQAASAPYMSYKGFKNYLVKFQTEGLPARFDGSYFGNVSGSIVAQVRGTLRYFDLIDDDRVPTAALQAIADASEADIATMMKAVFEAKYADCLALAQNATYDQLADVLRDRGLSGATVRKAVTFFIGMADDMGVPYSPHFKKARTSSGNGTTRRRTKKVTEPVPAPAPPVQQKEQDNSSEALRAKYINLLMTKVEQAGDGQLDADLLNRIERALGFEEQQHVTTATEEVGTKDLP